MQQTQLSDDLLGQRQRRIEALRKLRELGIDPFPAHSQKDQPNTHVVKNYAKFEGKTITLTGRLMSLREHGKLMFADIQDQSGRIQICIRKDQIEENLSKSFLGWTHLKLLDIGDFVQATGEIGKTQQEAVTLFTKHLKLLTKSIRPMPNSLDEKEQQFRRRYLDLTINHERKSLFERKAEFWRVSREFMHKKGFMEVETPVLEHVTGGADARPFITHHNTLDQNFYLRISSELYQKRLIGAGFEKIYTLSPNFRNEGLSDEHLQEYYQLEWYWAYADYRDNMEFVKEMFRELAQKVYGKTTFSTREHTFDLSNEWEEIDYVEIIKERLGIDIFTSTDEEMLEVAKKQGLKLEGEINRNRLIDNLWKIIRKTISGPAFLINEPKFMSPLAKSRPDNLALTERFHIIIAGSELGNGYSELNDPLDQLDRFIEQQRMREGGDDEAQMMDIDFVEMLEFGMPPTSGYGHSERVFWFLEDVTAREGTLFPQMRFEIDEHTKKIYGGMVDMKLMNPHLSAPKKDQPIKDDGIDYNAMYPKAEALLDEKIKNENLSRHCRDVEKCMRFYAKKLGQNEEKWAITGLLHDIDWEVFPETHPTTAVPMLEELGVGQDVIEAILGHAYPKITDVPRTTELAKYLFACDELAGFVIAYSRMKPLAEIEAKSVIKKMKDKGFARNVSREDMTLGAEEIGVEMNEHVENILEALRG